MLKNEIKILIVDDDVAFGAGMREALMREGFNPILVHKPEDALSQLKVHAISLAIIDCMLPKMNGRDLAKKMDEEHLGAPTVSTSFNGVQIKLSAGMTYAAVLANLRDELYPSGKSLKLTEVSEHPVDLISTLF